MPESLAHILIHFVVPTKNRGRRIMNCVRDDLRAYIAGIVQNLSCASHAAGSVEDHIHLLVAHPRSPSPAEIVEAMKTGPSR